MTITRLTCSNDDDNNISQPGMVGFLFPLKRGNAWAGIAKSGIPGRVLMKKLEGESK